MTSRSLTHPKPHQAPERAGANHPTSIPTHYFRVINGPCPALPGSGTELTGFWGPLRQVLRLAVDQAYSFLENPEWAGQGMCVLMTPADNLIVDERVADRKVGHSPVYDKGEVFVTGFRNLSQVTVIPWDEVFEVLEGFVVRNRQEAQVRVVNLTDPYGYDSLRLPGELWFEFKPSERLWCTCKWSQAFRRELKCRLRALRKEYTSVVVQGDAGEWRK